MRIGTYGTYVVVAILGLAAPATAQPAPGDSTAEADRLFNEGRAFLEAGKFKEACNSFERSIVEADAIGTRLNLALCNEKRGRLYTAMGQFEDTAERAARENQPESAAVARQHADDLRPQIPHLKFTITDPAPGQKIVLARPGQPDVLVTGSTTIDLDPTDHADSRDTIQIFASAPDRVSFQSEPFTLARGVTLPFTVPALAPSHLIGDVPPPPPKKKSRRKLYGIITGAGGVVVMLGSTLWAKTVSDSLTDACKALEPPCDDGTAASYKSSSEWTRLHIIAPTLFFVGVAAVGLGTYLYLSAPKNRDSQTAIVPTVGPDGGGIAVLRRF